MTDFAEQTDDLVGQEEEYDDLFGGEKLPSLFNKTHGVGTTLTGVITKPPVKRQSRFFKAGGKGALKFWAPPGSEKPVTDQAVMDGVRLRPCMDEVFVLATDYHLNEYELADKGMDEDSGERGLFASGDLKTAIKDAIRKSGVRTRQDLVGMRLTATRAGKTRKGDFEAWKWTAELTPTDRNAF